MFNSKKVYEKYGISGLIMPYIWLLIYIGIHYLLIGSWFTNPGVVEYISLFIHIGLTLIAFLFSHKVLLWAANNQEKGAASKFFAAIIRKMSESPLEALNSIFSPLANKEMKTSTKVMNVIFMILYTIVSITTGYIVFIIVAVAYLLSFIIKRRNNLA